MTMGWGYCEWVSRNFGWRSWDETFWSGGVFGVLRYLLRHGQGRDSAGQCGASRRIAGPIDNGEGSSAAGLAQCRDGRLGGDLHWVAL